MIDKQSEFIEHLFNTISNDPTMSADLKIALLRLQIPMHKLSLCDPHFISNPKHPARYTLSISKKISVLAKNNAAVIKKTQHILSELFNNSPNINKFSATNQQLEKLAASLPIKSSSTSSRDQNNTSHLKQLIAVKIKHCIEGYQIPSPCQNLVFKLWPIALYQLLKSYGENSKQWCSSIKLFCELLDSIQTVTNSNQHAALKENFLKIARKNNNFLLLYNQAEPVELAIKSLITHFNNLLKEANFYDANTIKTDRNSVLSKISLLPAAIKPGVWCEIYIDDVTPNRRLRLSFINMDTGKLIFVNRKGIKKLEKDAADFTEELNRGLSKLYKHDTLFTKPSSKTEYKKIG